MVAGGRAGGRAGGEEGISRDEDRLIWSGWSDREIWDCVCRVAEFVSLAAETIGAAQYVEKQAGWVLRSLVKLMRCVPDTVSICFFSKTATNFPELRHPF